MQPVLSYLVRLVIYGGIGIAEIVAFFWVLIKIIEWNQRRVRCRKDILNWTSKASGSLTALDPNDASKYDGRVFVEQLADCPYCKSTHRRLVPHGYAVSHIDRARKSLTDRHGGQNVYIVPEEGHEPN